MGTTTFSGPVKTGSIPSTGNSVLSSGISNTQPLSNVAMKRHLFPRAANATGIAIAQTYTSITPADGRFHLTLNGAECLAPDNTTAQGFWSPGRTLSNAGTNGFGGNTISAQSWARRIILTGAVATSAGATFDVTGTDATGRVLSETGITGPAAGATVSTVSHFMTVTSVTASANPNATATISAGTQAVTADLYVRPMGVIPFQSAIHQLKIDVAVNFNSAGATTNFDNLAIGTFSDVAAQTSVAAGFMYAGSVVAAAGASPNALVPITARNAGNQGIATGNSLGVAIPQSTVQQSNCQYVQQSPVQGAVGANFNQTDAGVCLFYSSLFTGVGAALATAGDLMTSVSYSQGLNIPNQTV